MSIPPTETPHPPPRRHARSLVLLHTGDGKGKTTAAMGILMRALGRGWRACVVQFVKSGDWKVTEERVARELGAEWTTVGDGFTWESDDLGRARVLALEAWAAAEERIGSGEFDLVVLDEVTYPVTWGWLDAQRVAGAIRERPAHVNVVMTGRDAATELVEVADTVTEMRKVRHAYDAGVPARRGIDF
ncbi:MAG: cob(I)yrinic acid a,c-diamide adenosyltransferase [Actinomycetota bacterium]|nr:cob(I)yrinic acid a,c-diamide adenosyltransferase [Actinomycetota bacterium]